MKNFKSTITFILIMLMVIAGVSASVSLLRLSPVKKSSDPGYTEQTVPADKCLVTIHVVDNNRMAVSLDSADISIYLGDISNDMSGAGYTDGNMASVLLPGTGDYTFIISVPGFQTYAGSIVVTNEDLGTSQVTSAVLQPEQEEQTEPEDGNQNVCTYRISAIDSVTNNTVSLEMSEPEIYIESDPSADTGIQGNLSDVWILSIPNVGEYSFSIALAGYEPYVGTITVTSEDIGLERMTTITLVPANV